MSKSTVYILLPIHNRYIVTVRHVKCFLNQTYNHYHLVIIDDGSTDGSVERIRKIIDKNKLTVINGNGNLFWAGALQKGYLWLKKREINDNDNIVVINDDTEIEEDFLRKGCSYLKSHENTVLVAQNIDKDTKENIDVGIHIDWKRLKFNQANSVNEINCLATRGLFMSVKKFIQVGGFKPNLLPHYFSDYEFTIRAKRKGFKLITVPDIRIYTDMKAEANYEINVRNMFSKKLKTNPFYLSIFILLAAPWVWKAVCLALVWIKTIVKIVKNSVIILRK